MATVTKAANAHTVVATGWTTPANAYSTTNDSAYATIATARNATYSGDFGFPAFTTGDIPDGSTINSVTVYTTYGLSATATGALVGCQARRNSTGTTLGSEITRTAATMADANVVATGCTLADLQTANELRVRARGTKGNSSTASTARIDRLYVTVTYTPPVDNRNANFTSTGGGVAVEVGTKGGKLAATGTGGGVLAASPTGIHTTAVASTGGGVTVAAISAGRAASASATGGGVLAVARVAGRTSSVAARGGGVASVTAEKAISAEDHNASVVATGGGVAVASVRSARYRAAVATASGVATVAPVAGRRSSPASVGGGVVAVAASTRRLVATAASASGRASASIAAAHQLAVAMTGGGAGALGVTGSRYAHLQATGAGVAIVDGRARPAQQLPGLTAAARIHAATAGEPEIAGAPAISVVAISDAPVITSARFIP